MGRHNFKNLKIWQEGISLAGMSYGVTKGFPDSEKFNLVSQMNRCAVSIPSNIAEGSGKGTNKHFKVFLENSLGSAFEWETQLIISHNENFLDHESFRHLEEKILNLQKMIGGFLNNLEDDHKNKKSSL